MGCCLNLSAQETWGKIEYQGDPWVRKMSRPNEIKHGLWNRHISLWASHGRYYDQKKGSWQWQRPYLFGTTEDLFTQTIVVPYLIPMLENAGAVVFTPRERDWQKNEIIVDNDNQTSFSYAETHGSHRWETSQGKGFAHSGVPIYHNWKEYHCYRSRWCFRRLSGVGKKCFHGCRTESAHETDLCQ